MVIKHLVFSGGAQYGVTSYSAIEHIKEAGYIKYDNIESIYATSAGTVNAVLFCLNIEKTLMYDYIINRHWSKDFLLNPDSFTNLIFKKGLYEMNCFDNFFKPLFAIKDIDIDITMKDFYDKFKIFMEFNTICINSFEIKKINHITYPDIPVIQAVKMSSSIPLIFTPVYFDNNYYIDGGVLINYPLNSCINNKKCDLNEILGIRVNFDINKKNEMDVMNCSVSIPNDDNEYLTNNSEKEELNDKSNIITYLQHLLLNIIRMLDTSHIQTNICNELIIYSNGLSLENIKNFVTNINIRKQLLSAGEIYAKQYIEKLDSDN